jgi:hypothetical protein
MSVEPSKSLSLQGATSQTGTGITFPATQSASTDVNTLDDYEEGTFTPTITTTSGTLTAYTSAGSYTKIGNQIFLAFQFTITTNGTGAGSFLVGNLPFTVTSSVAQGFGAESAATGMMLNVQKYDNTRFQVTKYDYTYPGANGYVLNCRAFYTN